MRRKIALLLAFAMVLSILPMNLTSVSVAASPAVLGGGTRTGMIAEPAGPARNVRDWGSGVAVGRQWIIDAMFPVGSAPAAAPQGNLRHIFADAAYFAGRADGITGPQAASITMDIHNVRRWLGWQAGPNWSPAVSVWRTLDNNQTGGVSQFSATTPAAAPAPPANWQANPGQSIINTATTGIQAGAVANFTSFINDSIYASGGTPSEALIELATGVFLLGEYHPVAQADFINTFFTNFSNPTRVALSIRTAPTGMGLPPGFITFAAGIMTGPVPIGSTRASLDLWRPFGSGATVANFPTALRDWAGTTLFTGQMTTGNIESVLTFMTSVDNWVQLPIEYVTHEDANENAIFLNFFENSGWPQAGQIRPGGGIPGRTEISAVTQARFDFGLGSGPIDNVRTFHRYQRGMLPSIRIAEGAQGAFDNQFWWIELEIQEAGFFFTEDSIDDIRFTTRWGGPTPAATTVAWPGNGIATGTPPASTGAPWNRLGPWDGWRPAVTGNNARNVSQLGMLRIEDGPVRREPETGPSRYTRLIFGVELPGVATGAQRTVNDWIDIHHLSIVADDRARGPEVNIKVDLYRAPLQVTEPQPGFTGTVPGLTGWNWVPVNAATNPIAPPSHNFGLGTVAWWGLHPGVSGIPGAAPWVMEVNTNQAQVRGESIFVYARTPQTFERFDATEQDHLNSRGDFIFLPHQVGLDPNTPGLRNQFRWNGNPINQNDAFSIPDDDAIEFNWPLIENGFADPLFTDIQRANFWRRVLVGEPRYFAYAAQTPPTANAMTEMQTAFNAAVAFHPLSGTPANVSAPPGGFTPRMQNIIGIDNIGTPGQIWERFDDSVAPWTLVGTLQWQMQEQTITLTPTGGARPFHVRGPHVADGTVHVANFGSLGLEFDLHVDADANDHWLLSGRRDWEFSRAVTNDGRRPIGVVTQILDDTHHLTARATLRERSAGALAATGAIPVTFSFDEGIQILAAHVWTNNGDFVRFNDMDQRINFSDRLNVADGFMGATIERNTLTLRPEIGTTGQRWRLAEISVEFYLSVMPGYAREFLEDAIQVHVEATDASDTSRPFTASVVVAYVDDPIDVDTTVATVGTISPAEFGSLHVIPINDVTITEVASQTLEVGTRLWVGVEGGISRGFGAADHISLTAGSVEVVPEGAIGISQLRSDTHGAYVEITRASGVNTNGAQIIFRDVQVTGRVFADTEYNIIVAGNSVAANWEEFLWLDGDMPTGIARGGIHGFFHEEPYPTPAFVFAGEDVGITELPAPAPPPAPPAPPAQVGLGPTVLTQNVGFPRPNGEVINPPFEMVPTARDPLNTSTAFISVAAISDILGWQLSWDSPTATFTKPNGDVLVFTLNEPTATLNGNVMPMLDALGSQVQARNTNNRLMVPIRFFRELGINVQWLGGSSGRFSIAITP